MKNRRERTNGGLAQATIQEVLHKKPMFRTTFVTCSRTSQTDGYRRPRRTGFLPQKKSPKKPINRMCLGEESTDDPHTVRQQHRRLHTVRQQHHRPKTEGASKVVRDGDSGNSLRQSVSAQSTWSGCEVELGTCHCLPYDVHLVHTRVPFSHTHSRRVIADDRESILCGGAPPRGLSDETTSLGTMATAMESKSQLQPFNTSNLDDFCSANHFRRATRVWSHRENCKDFLAPMAFLQQPRQ